MSLSTLQVLVNEIITSKLDIEQLSERLIIKFAMLILMEFEICMNYVEAAKIIR